MTLRPHITEYLRYRRAQRSMASVSIRDAHYTLESFADSFGARPLSQLGPAAVDAWMAQIAHLSPATRRNYLSRVRTFLDWMVDRKLIAKNPARGVRVAQPRSVPRALPHDRVAALLEHAPDNRARLVILLMVEMGLRCVEVERLTVGDYDPQGRTMLLTGKGGHQRMLPVTDGVRHALDVYLAEVGTTAGPLVRSYVRPWAGVSARTISKWLRMWMRDAGVKHRALDGVSAHALRHTAASDILDHCHDVTIVQAVLGHSTVAVTSRYLRVANLGQMRDAMSGRDYRAGREPAPVRKRAA